MAQLTSEPFDAKSRNLQMWKIQPAVQQIRKSTQITSPTNRSRPGAFRAVSNGSRDGAGNTSLRQT